MAKSSIKNVGEFMSLARDRYELALAADSEDRAAAEEDVAFVAGDQWRDDAVQRRKKAKVPILTWNRLGVFVAQVVNDGRQNKPAIKTMALDGGKKETAEFFQSRIRQLEYDCDADIAYDTAREQQVVSGRGFIRVGTEFQTGKTFKQRATIEPIENQFSVLFDPAARKYDRSDADWCFVFSHTSKEAYERKYGKNTAAAAANYFANESNPAPDWINCGTNGDFIQVAEYWLKEHRQRALCLFPDLTAAWRDELPREFDEALIMDERDVDDVTVCQYIIDGVEPLAETEFAVPHIPIVPLWGKQMVVAGKRCNYSLVRFAKDPQRLVNLYVSNIAGEIARTSKTPYIVAEGQILGREHEWETMNEDPRTVIQYKAKDVAGNLIGKPTRETVEPPIQALTLGLNQAIDAIKAAMGIYDAQLGAKSNETSGIAIERRKKQSNATNFHFPDNEARTRKSIGRILLALIPVLDRGANEVPTRSEDGKTTLVKLGQPYLDPKTGATIEHDLENGEYGVGVATGPSHASQREEAFDVYSQIANADKGFMQIAGDLLFRNMDAPGAEQIADRYEKMLPPQLKPRDESEAGQADQQAQAVQQLSAQNEQMGAQLHDMAQQLETNQAAENTKIEIARMQEETKRDIAKSADATKLAIAQIGAGVQDQARAAADALAVLKIREAMEDRAHEAALASSAQAAAAAGQLASQEHATDQQRATQDHATATAQQGQQHAAGMQQNAQDAAAKAAAAVPPAELAVAA